jgi:hypothetical protein
MRKLTPAMADLLEAMKRGVRVHYLGGTNAYYFRNDTMKNCTRQVEGLLDRGAIKLYWSSPWSRGVALTEREGH